MSSNNLLALNFASKFFVSLKYASTHNGNEFTHENDEYTAERPNAQLKYERNNRKCDQSQFIKKSMCYFSSIANHLQH